MITSKLPARPSPESLRKQAKKLARAIVAGDAPAIGRARTQLPQAKLPLSQRDAQLVLARDTKIFEALSHTSAVPDGEESKLEGAVPGAFSLTAAMQFMRIE